MITNANHQKILIVDDELEIVDSLKTFLEISGFDNIREACNGNDALSIISNEEISLIISDVKMPGLDGISLLKKTHVEFPQTPVFLMVTGYNEVTPEEAHKLGARMVLTKPLDLNAFIDQIELVLKH